MMAIRFNKSIRLGKGVRVNLSKKGIGMSTGMKGARVGLNSKGTYTSTSIPGTGISSIKYHKDDTKKVLSDKDKQSEVTGKDSVAGLFILIGIIILFFNVIVGILWIMCTFLVYHYLSSALITEAQETSIKSE